MLLVWRRAIERIQKQKIETKQKDIESNEMSMVEEKSDCSTNIDGWCRQQKSFLFDGCRQEGLEFLI